MVWCGVVWCGVHVCLSHTSLHTVPYVVHQSGDGGGGQPCGVHMLFECPTSCCICLRSGHYVSMECSKFPKKSERYHQVTLHCFRIIMVIDTYEAGCYFVLVFGQCFFFCFVRGICSRIPKSSKSSTPPNTWAHMVCIHVCM